MAAWRFLPRLGPVRGLFLGTAILGERTPAARVVHADHDA